MQPNLTKKNVTLPPKGGKFCVSLFPRSSRIAARGTMINARRCTGKSYEQQQCKALKRCTNTPNNLRMDPTINCHAASLHRATRAASTRCSATTALNPKPMLILPGQSMKYLILSKYLT